MADQTEDPTAAIAEALGEAQDAIDRAAEAAGVEPVKPKPAGSMNDAIRAKAGRGAVASGGQAA